MRTLALKGLPDVRDAVADLGLDVPGPSELDTFLRARWDVVPDPEDAELIRTPLHQWRLIYQHGRFAGDCDDAAVMAALLCAAQNVPCWFIAIRLRGEPEFCHVWTRAAVGPYGIDIDPTTPREFLPVHGFAEAVAVEVWPNMEESDYAAPVE